MDPILVVEDEPALRHSLCRLLRQEELTLRETGSLRDAVRLLVEEPPSLIVSDLDLPDGSGLELLQELTLRGLRVPVIFITAYLARFARELPASSNIDVLEKPFAQADFIGLVKRRLASRVSAVPASGFSVADYLQLAGLARRNVCLTVIGAGGIRGMIIVQEGQSIWAEDQQGEGVEAFRRLALLSDAEVSCRPADVKVATPNVQGSLEQLLLDAARRADEAAPAQHLEPPRPAPREPLPREPLPREKGVSVPRPLRAARNLEELLSPALVGIARAERDGSVLELAGELDAETSCAVATVASRQVEELAAELGLGDVLCWHACMGKSSWYVALSREQMLVGMGGPNKNPGSTLSKLDEACGRRS